MKNTESEGRKMVIKPELLGGFRDYLPEIMIFRQKVIETIREIFERFGFLPIETPSLERSSVLGTDRDEFKMEVYRFNDDQNGMGQDVTLRFDLTVPLSRVIAANPKLLKPFKRYQRGSVWRKEKPQSGRFREFTQFDADIVGSDSILADTEIIILMYQTLINLGIGNFIIRFNNRKILNGLSAVALFNPDKSEKVFRVLDKLEKIGPAEIFRELQRKPDNEFDETAIGLNDLSIDKIKEFLNFTESGNNVVAKLKEFFKGVSIAEEGILECEEIMRNLSMLNIPSENWQLDLSVARGLGYYTGPVFETTLNDLPEIGSVFSGGRFDDLITRFTGQRIPAVGASIGVDRLIAALEYLKQIVKVKSTARVIVSILDEKMYLDSLRLANNLRLYGINTEIYLGKGSLKEQIIYTAKRGIPFMIILGEDEKQTGKIKLKNMEERKEELLTEKELVDKLLAIK